MSFKLGWGDDAIIFLLDDLGVREEMRGIMRAVLEWRGTRMGHQEESAVVRPPSKTSRSWGATNCERLNNDKS